MPQIGWLEILSVVVIAILVLGPKEFPIALKKIGIYVGKIKNTFANFQKEVSSLSQDIDKDDQIISKEEKIKKDMSKNG
jgi:sec-independent protein translocase protein TatB